MYIKINLLHSQLIFLLLQNILNPLFFYKFVKIQYSIGMINFPLDAQDHVLMSSKQLKGYLSSRRHLDFALKLALGTQANLHDISAIDQENVLSLASLQNRPSPIKSLARSVGKKVGRSKFSQKQNQNNEDEIRSIQNYLQKNNSQQLFANQQLQKISCWIDFVKNHCKLTVKRQQKYYRSSSSQTNRSSGRSWHTNKSKQQAKRKIYGLSIDEINQFFKEITNRMQRLQIIENQSYNSTFLFCKLTEASFKQKQYEDKINKLACELKQKCACINLLQQKLNLMKPSIVVPRQKQLMIESNQIGLDSLLSNQVKKQFQQSSMNYTPSQSVINQNKLTFPDKVNIENKINTKNMNNQNCYRLQNLFSQSEIQGEDESMLLVNSIVKNNNKKYNQQDQNLSSKYTPNLFKHSWQGNVLDFINPYISLIKTQPNQNCKLIENNKQINQQSSINQQQLQYIKDQMERLITQNLQYKRIVQQMEHEIQMLRNKNNEQLAVDNRNLFDKQNNSQLKIMQSISQTLINQNSANRVSQYKVALNSYKNIQSSKCEKTQQVININLSYPIILSLPITSKKVPAQNRGDSNNENYQQNHYNNSVTNNTTIFTLNQSTCHKDCFKQIQELKSKAKELSQLNQQLKSKNQLLAEIIQIEKRQNKTLTKKLLELEQFLKFKQIQYTFNSNSLLNFHLEKSITQEKFITQQRYITQEKQTQFDQQIQLLNFETLCDKNQISLLDNPLDKQYRTNNSQQQVLSKYQETVQLLKQTHPQVKKFYLIILQQSDKLRNNLSNKCQQLRKIKQILHQAKNINDQGIAAIELSIKVREQKRLKQILSLKQVESRWLAQYQLIKQRNQQQMEQIKQKDKSLKLNINKKLFKFNQSKNKQKHSRKVII